MQLTAFDLVQLNKMDPESAIGVGSIAHILKTAFKSVYEEEQQVKDSVIAAEARKIADNEKALLAIELAAIAEAEELEKAKLDPKKGKRVSISKSAIVVPDLLPDGML